MKRHIANQLTYAKVTATIALFIALGGTAFAAAALPRNSVGKAQLRTAAVGSAEVRDGSLQLRDMSSKARKALRPTAPPPTGSAGAPTAPGQPPAAGPTTPASQQALEVSVKKVDRTLATAPEDDTTIGGATATCDAGQKAIAGGVQVSDPVEVFAIDSYPEANGVAWTARAGNDDDAAPHNFSVYVICSA